MNLIESYMLPLSSGTTCYSCAPRVQGWTVRFATRLHTCFLRRKPNSADHLGAAVHEEAYMLMWNEVAPFTQSNHSIGDTQSICVGYSSCQDWETIVLLDSSKVLPPQQNQLEDPYPLTRPNSEFRRDGDDGSVLSSTAPSLADPAQHHRRASSIISFDSVMLQPTFSFPVDTNQSLQEPAVAASSIGVSQMILRQLNPLNNSVMEEFCTLLNFRPLAPVVCKLHMKEDNGEAGSPCIWSGAADNTKLHLFVPAGPNSLESVPLDDEAFQFESPVMALDFRTTASQGMNCLGVACQDGTIRFISFDCNRRIFTSVRQAQVIVDGPIVCIHFRETNNGLIHVSAGSLCGYVMELLLDPTTMHFEGPFMVADQLWDDSLGVEDSVLSVSSMEDLVLVGTHAGRCQVYRKLPSTNDRPTIDSRYTLIWECQLPYPVNAVCFFDGSLWVTTRRSFHIFKQDVSAIKVAGAEIKQTLDRFIHLYNECQLTTLSIPSRREAPSSLVNESGS